MTDKQHPITPPPELVEKWSADALARTCRENGTHAQYKFALADQAARWGADQELDACCEWFVRDWTDIETADKLRAARRPKPQSLAEEALLAIDTAVADDRLSPAVAHAVRRALERLQELEGQADD